MSPRGAAALGLLVALLCGGCVPAEGTLELRWRLAPDDAAGFSALELEPTWAGAGRGSHRERGWDLLPVPSQPVTVAAGGPPVTVARGRLPARPYDRVFAAAPDVFGRQPDGTRVPLVSHIEPIARGVDIRGGGIVTVDIELIVLPAAGGRPGWEVFVRGAVLATPQAADYTAAPRHAAARSPAALLAPGARADH